jgi:hypothetical protein
MIYDRSSDPHDDNNLLCLLNTELSLKQYPNIKVGEDFTGCKK